MFVLVVAVLMLIISAITWAIATSNGNPQLAQKARARVPHLFGDGDDLLLAFDGAGAGDDLKVRPAELVPADVDDRVVRVELAAGLFKRLLNALDTLDSFEPGDEVDVHLCGVPDEAEYRLEPAAREMRLDAHAVEPAREIVDLVVADVFFQNYNHVFFLSSRSGNKKAPLRSCTLRRLKFVRLIFLRFSGLCSNTSISLAIIKGKACVSVKVFVCKAALHHVCCSFPEFG